MINCEYSPLFATEQDIPEIMDLFKAVYPNRECPPEEYWLWLFDNPFGYTALVILDGEKLIAYSAAIHREKSAFLSSSMSHPDYRGKGVFSYLAKKMIYLLSKCVPYVYFASNKVIYNLWVRLGFQPDLQVSEYQRKPYKLIQRVAPYRSYDYPTDWLRWRFDQHPTREYWFYKWNDNFCVMSEYENKAQIVWFKYWDVSVFRIAHAHARNHRKDLITVWAPKKPKGFEEVKVNEWYMYRKFKRFTKIPKTIMMGEVEQF